MKDQPSAKMIELCRKGKSQGYVWLLREYGPRLYGYFLRVTGSAADAEDMVQELFVTLLKKVKKYRHQDRFEHWLFRVAANLARDRHRRLSRQQKTISLSTSGAGDWAQNLVGREVLPEQEVLKAEQQDRLAQALAQLEPLDREIIMLRYYGNLNFKQLAEHFRMPLGTTLTKVHRGLKKLQKILKDD